jgi:UDPglucose 6-dehydrogenase
MSKIAIVGLQHQGYVLAACFAKIGHTVVAVRSAAESGKAPEEPELAGFLQAGLDAHRLQFTTDLQGAVSLADFVFLSSDIAFDGDGVKLAPVLELAREIGLYRSLESILCVTTQVPVGTTETLTKGKVAYVPELLRPHHAVNTFMCADRIIVGSDDPRVAERVASLYLPLGRPILLMGLRSAEMSKHVHNAILATQISFVNEMEKICKKTGAEIQDVARAVKADLRVGNASYLNPGWSLKGGHAIRDVRVLRSLGVKTPLMDAVIEVEESL